jgi:hypothetical protein
MLQALCDHLLEKPDLYQDEMVVFLWDEFRVCVITFSIGRALASMGWFKKTTWRVAKEQNADLRDFYLYKLLIFRSYHLVFINKLGYIKQVGFRQIDWSLLSVIPVQIFWFQREQRYQILPTYALDGVVLA